MTQTKKSECENSAINLKPEESQEEIVESTVEEIEEKPKHIPQKPQKFGPMFSKGNQFRGGMGNNYSSKMRIGRGASRGR